MIITCKYFALIFLCLHFSFCKLHDENSLDATIEVESSLQSANGDRETYSVFTLLPPISSSLRENGNGSNAHDRTKILENNNEAIEPNLKVPKLNLISDEESDALEPNHKAQKHKLDAPEPNHNTPKPSLEAPEPNHRVSNPNLKAPEPILVSDEESGALLGVNKTTEAPETNHDATKPKLVASEPNHRASNPNLKAPEPNFVSDAESDALLEVNKKTEALETNHDATEPKLVAPEPNLATNEGSESKVENKATNPPEAKHEALKLNIEVSKSNLIASKPNFEAQEPNFVTDGESDALLEVNNKTKFPEPNHEVPEPNHEVAEPNLATNGELASLVENKATNTLELTHVAPKLNLETTEHNHIASKPNFEASEPIFVTDKESDALLEVNKTTESPEPNHEAPEPNLVIDEESESLDENKGTEAPESHHEVPKSNFKASELNHKASKPNLKASKPIFVTDEDSNDLLEVSKTTEALEPKHDTLKPNLDAHEPNIFTDEESVNEATEAPELNQDVNSESTLLIVNHEEYVLLENSNLPLNKCNYTDHKVSNVLTIRKCCQEREFFNNLLGECETITDSYKLNSEIKKFAKIPNSSVVNTFSKTIDECEPRIIDLSTDPSYGIIGSGHIYDCSSTLEYNIAQYCLEMSGSELENAVLWLVYCPKTIVIPKCCSEGHFYDKISYCTPYSYTDYEYGEGGGDDLLHPYLGVDFELNPGDLRCEFSPVEINLNQTELIGSTLCLLNYNQCYEWDKYCVENIVQEGRSEVVQAALICPKIVIAKCCPDGQLLHYEKCEAFDEKSPQLAHILKTNIYNVESVVNRRMDCDPIMVENNTNLEIFWSVDSEGNAVISHQNSVVQNITIFCVDDFINAAMEVTPVLHVCTVDFHNEILSGKVLQKCCPADMVYFAEADNATDKCISKTDFKANLFEIYELQKWNISHFQIHEFPQDCPQLFSYNLGISDLDGNYVELTNATSLKITNKRDNCTTKEAPVIDPSTFCVDIRFQNGSFRPVVLVCDYGESSTYAEKKYIIGCLTGLSVGALAVSLVMLACTRVRRGMFTVRKMNTLAGRILICYVVSQLVGYAILGFTTLWSFAEGNQMCFFLSGLLQFSMIAAFCWNTAICLEGLLLTMDVRMSERKRFVCHSLWAWGIPAVITAITLTVDTHRTSFSCDAITPKIGVDRCFFSDFRAQLLYMYLPISILVLLNAVFLVSGKVLRQAQLRKLEEGHANFRAKNSGTVPSTNSGGLRTHQTKNMWIESVKLVIWSGITWLLEMVGTAVTLRGAGSDGEWFNYLWYIPMGANCLRGLGIFFILSVTSEQQTKLYRLARFLSAGLSRSINKLVANDRSNSKARSNKDIELSVTAEGFSSTCATLDTKLTNSEDSELDNNKNDRKTSVSTIISNLSDTTRKTSVSTIVTNISDDRKTSISTIISNISDFPDFQNDGSSYSTTTPPMYRSISHYAPRKLYKVPLPHVNEDLEYENRQSWIDPDTSSLDNTLMEATFLEGNNPAIENELNKHPEVNLDSDLDSGTIIDTIVPKVNFASSGELEYDQIDKVRKRKSNIQASLDSKSGHPRSPVNSENRKNYLKEIQKEEVENGSSTKL